MRHGRTAWNADGRFQGHTDVPLDDTGRAQARALGALVRAELPHIDHAVSSDLVRARETAEIVLAGRTVPLEFDAAWREMRFGAWEGLAWPAIVARHPELAERSSTSPAVYTPDGSETFDALCERVAAAVTGLAARARPGDRVLVVTHAGVLHALVRVVLGTEAANALGVRFAPATLSRFALDPRGNRILELNRSAEPASAAAAGAGGPAASE